MRRRKFLALLCGAFTLPLAARAQQASVPLIGFISSRSPDDSAPEFYHVRKSIAELGLKHHLPIIAGHGKLRGRYDHRSR
jgi:hypothetical protein